MTKVNPDNGNVTKTNIFSMNTLKSEIIFHWSLKYSNDFITGMTSKLK